MMPSIKKKVLIVRGDLVSSSGYSRALRAHVTTLSKYFSEVFGVELHPNPNDFASSFPGRIIQDADIHGLCRNNEVTLLNYCLPELFRREPEAMLNIGLFYWETDRFNPKHNWGSFINLMDEIWIPSHFMEGLLQAANFKGTIKYYPWPLKSDPSDSIDHAVDGYSFEQKKTGLFLASLFWYSFGDFFSLPDFFKHFFTRLFKPKWYRFYNLTLNQFCAQYDFIFLNMLQTSSRKGFRLTLSEWFSFVEQNPTAKTGLILKLNPINHSDLPSAFLLDVQAEIHRIAQSFNIKYYNIFLVTHRLTDHQIEGLYSKTSAFISTTLGEGFGGPMAEAIMRKIPVIIPRHSSLTDLIESDYPLAIPSTSVNLSLADQLTYYSLSSRWSLIEPNSLKVKLELFMKMSKVNQLTLGLKTQENLKQLITSALEKCLC